MKNPCASFFLLFLVASCIGSPSGAVTSVPSVIQSVTDVFIVYDDASYPPNDATRSWVANNDIPRELIVRSPTAFTNKGGQVMLELDGSLTGFRELKRVHTGVDPDIDLISCEYSVVKGGSGAKSRIVTFPASKLLGTSGKVASQAGEYGLIKAVEASGMKVGTAWVRGISCSNGVFSVEVTIR